jgi:spermidine/putrescine transport system ATP-binding protein
VSERTKLALGDQNLSSTEMEEPYDVELVKVSKRFRDTAALSDVSFEVGRGEFLTLLGPSGCGKTTLLRIVGGFTSPEAGRVLLGGRDVTRLPPFRRDVTTVFQQYALFPHMNVFDNVAFGLERRGVPAGEIKRRVAISLEMVRLNGLEPRVPSELSGGQQQRVALARALVVEPRVLLLDEPLAALDLKLRKQMRVELKSLQRRVGISFIFVTHDQEEALTMSDRVAVMNAGRIEQLARPEQIYERPQTEFVADFIGMSNIIDGTVVEVNEAESIIKVCNARIRILDTHARPGERVRLMIRPEKISLGSNGADGALIGTIESAVYLGDSTHWKVAIGPDQTITVLEQNRERSLRIDGRIGETVSVKWEPSCAVLLHG